MCTTRVLHYVTIQIQCVGWMEKDVVRRLECPWFGGCLAIRVLTVISVWCPLFKMVCPWRKSQQFCIRIYHKQFGLCCLEMDFLFMNFRTILLCSLTTMTVFLKQRRTAAISFKRCRLLAKLRLLQSSRSQKANSMTSSRISNFQKIKQTIWHQCYNCGIYYTTPWKWQNFAQETKNSNSSLKPYVISPNAKTLMVWWIQCT